MLFELFRNDNEEFVDSHIVMHSTSAKRNGAGNVILHRKSDESIIEAGRSYIGNYSCTSPIMM